MKIRLLTGMAGDDFSLSPGDVTEQFPDDECQRLIDAGYAEAVTPKMEKAVKAPPTEIR